MNLYMKDESDLKLKEECYLLSSLASLSSNLYISAIYSVCVALVKKSSQVFKSRKQNVLRCICRGFSF